MAIKDFISINEANNCIERFSKRNMQSPYFHYPKRLVQFWDKDIPSEVEILLVRNAQLCKIYGYNYFLYSESSARLFLKSHGFDSIVVEAFDAAPHPAIKADLFRLAEISVNGGFYLDADMVLRETFFNVVNKGSSVFFKWSMGDRRNVCNWFFGGSGNGTFFENLTVGAAKNIISYCYNGSDAKGSVLNVAGPGFVTRSIANELKKNRVHSINIREVSEAFKFFVQNGRNFLGEPLSYKSTGLHWSN